MTLCFKNLFQCFASSFKLKTCLQDKPKKKRFNDSDRVSSDSELDSDLESDSESESEQTTSKKKSLTGSQHVTSAMVDKWSRQLEKNPRLEVC